MAENTHNVKKPSDESKHTIENTSTAQKDSTDQSKLPECTIDMKTPSADPIKKVEAKMENTKVVVSGLFEKAVAAIQCGFRTVKNAIKRFYNWVSEGLFGDKSSTVG